ncbi:MAG TPA: hypothetical protein VMV39_03640 [Terracidiphilus sp.]|nr:hypothetical protein [Terracidiphilus sp.]
MSRIANPLSLIALADVACVWKVTSRLLLLLTGTMVAAMPLTERIWVWDHFLQGGHDFEFGLLAIATSLCLLLVLAHQREQCVNLLLAPECLPRSISNDRGLGGVNTGVFDRGCGFERAAGLANGNCNLSLQI